MHRLVSAFVIRTQQKHVIFTSLIHIILSLEFDIQHLFQLLSLFSPQSQKWKVWIWTKSRKTQLLSSKPITELQLGIMHELRLTFRVHVCLL